MGSQHDVYPKQMNPANYSQNADRLVILNGGDVAMEILPQKCSIMQGLELSTL